MHHGSARVLGLVGTLLVAGGLMGAMVLATAPPAHPAELHITIGPPVLREIPKIIPVPWDASDEARDRRATWYRVCQPRVWVGSDGVGRYVYGPACPDGVMRNTWLEVPND